MKMISRLASKGVAMITVMLIILTLTMVALFTLMMTKNETQASSAFRFNRQAAYAVRGVSNVMLSKLDNFETTDASGNNISTDDADKVIFELKQGKSPLFKTTVFTPSTGLGETLTATNNTYDSNRLQGDLKRPFIQMGSYDNLSLIIGDTPGMSDSSMFCRYTMQVNAVVMAGRVSEPLKSNGNEYFTISSLNKVSARKYEMGYVKYEPAGCQ